MTALPLPPQAGRCRCGQPGCSDAPDLPEGRYVHVTSPLQALSLDPAGRAAIIRRYVTAGRVHIPAQGTGLEAELRAYTPPARSPGGATLGGHRAAYSPRREAYLDDPGYTARHRAAAGAPALDAERPVL